MSLKKSATRRLSLLTGSSLVAASVSAFALTGASLAPSAAYAYDECVPGNPPTTQSDGAGGVSDVTLNGTTADTFFCAGVIPSITYPDTAGNLTLTLQGTLGVTGGLHATPDSTHSITINRSNLDTANAGDPSLANSNGAALEVIRSVSGTINVTLNDNDTGDDPMVISGTTAGVRLLNTGTGTTTFSTNRALISSSTGAAIEVGTTGTGNITVTAGFADTLEQTVVTGATAAVLITGGNNATINNNALMNGIVQANNTGSFTYNNRSIWTFSGMAFLGVGNSVVDNDQVGGTLRNAIVTNIDGAATTMDFGSGTDRFDNTRLIVGGGEEAASTLVITGLEVWNNAGFITFGSQDSAMGSDGVPNDRIVVVGSTLFTGVLPPAVGDADGGVRSTLFMDVDFTGGMQTSCAVAVAADCLDLRGSTTAGLTHVRINGLNMSAATPKLTPIVLVDVNGGVSGEGHFVLDNDSTGWRRGGAYGIIEAGVFAYSVSYDAATQQHVLAPQPGAPLVALSQLGEAARGAWDTTTSTYLGRQADLRQTVLARGESSGPGVWLKLAGGHTERTHYQTYALDGFDYEFNTGLTQNTQALVGGVDFLSVSAEDQAWVVGLTAGTVTSEADFTSAAGVVEMDGYSLGLYASVVAGGLYVDGIVNANRLDLAYDGPGVSGAGGKVASHGWRAETGYRLPIGENTYLEPLAAIAYFNADIDDLPLSEDVVVGFDEATSLRAGIGARYGGSLPMEAFTTNFALTGRVWGESEGENTASLRDADPDFAVWSDTSAEALGDVGLTLSFVGNGGRLSAFVDGGVKFMQDYVSTDASIGFRYGW